MNRIDQLLPLDRVLYTPERLIAIADEAAKPDSPFSLEDRVGLVHDALALARAGYMDISAVLSLYNAFRHEEQRKFLV
jgi:aminopeptidase 2